MNKRQISRISRLRTEAEKRGEELETKSQSANVICREVLMKMAKKYRQQAKEYGDQIGIL